MNALLHTESNRIIELMEQPAQHRDAGWLKDAVQQAILLELATLPPYLCGMWSIDDASGGDVFDAVHAIVFDEMSHLGLACNLLTTIGGAPRLADEGAVPKYPGPLPGGVRPELTVFLSGLTKDSLEMYSRIEEPDDPLAEAVAPPTSIGAFYNAILDVFREHPELITGARQVVKIMAAGHGSGNDVVALDSPAAVESAIAVIKEQGEGTSASPENPHPGEVGELAHYYVFREIYRGHKLIKVSTDPDEWDFQGAEIPMPHALPMGIVPSGGWPREGPTAVDVDTRNLLDGFNTSYSAMLGFLEQAWQQDLPAKAKVLLGKAVGEMVGLQEPAQSLMRRALPDGSGNAYGPEFRYVAA
ncbi:ferritin-like protein [Streptomyces sp. NPDC056891]|uniref:ferritin-like domain-containing protein n=1 Tax=Streptomyces sp. NPDC056891 TaxID=3345961 RepID=UPI0036A99CEB